MHPLLTTDAIILKEEDYREFDKIFTIFTKNFGKINAIGRSIRKKNAKLKYSLQVLNFVNLEFIEGKSFYIICDVILKDDFQNVKDDFPRLKIALKILNIFNEFIQGEEEDRKIWNLILASIKKLSQTQNYQIKNLKIFYFYFIWKLISSLGFNPELYKCVICKKPLQEKKQQKNQNDYFNSYFLIENGGLICQTCGNKYQNKKIVVSSNTIKLLRFILKDDKILKRIRVSQSDEDELIKLTKEFINYLEFQNIIFN